jgi:parallel beta-helix repeat protein
LDAVVNPLLIFPLANVTRGYLGKTINSHAVTCLACILLASGLAFAVTQARASTFTSHAPIVISGDSDFTSANGVTEGTGAGSDPYVIQGWNISLAGCCNKIGISINNTRVFFVIRNMYLNAGIEMGNVTNGIVQGSEMNAYRWGMILDSSENILVTDNTVRYDISATSSNNVTLAHNNINGIDVSSSNNLAIIDNQLLTEASGCGACIDHSSNATITGNNFAPLCDCTGVGVYYSDHVTIFGNNIQTEVGVNLRGSSFVEISNNKLSGSAYVGVNIWFSSATVLDNNTIQFSEFGIFLSGSESIQVFHNNFLKNTIQATDTNGTNNSWDNGYPSGGNFWSDYTGVDNCSGSNQDVCPSPDGIGDTPYVFNQNQDNYPLMQPFGTTTGGGPATTYTLSWQGYDWDGFGEENLTLNGQFLASFPTTDSPQNGGSLAAFSVNTTSLVHGTNTLTLTHADWDCGVSDNVQNLQVASGTFVVYSNSTSQPLSCTQSLTYTFTV